MRLLVLLPATLLAVTALGCAGNQPPDPNNPYGANPGYANPGYANPGYANPGYANPGYANPGYTNPGAAAPGYNPPPAYGNPSYGAPGTPGYGPPANPGYGPPGSAPPAPPAGGGGAATPIAPGAAAAATPVLLGLGQQEAPGAQADGSVFAGQFQEGQTLEQPINIQAGKCYTVVAVGMGVQQVDIQLVAQAVPMLPPTVLAQSNSGGATSTLGGRAAGCFKNPLPVGGPAKILLKATRGAGLIAAQAYSK